MTNTRMEIGGHWKIFIKSLSEQFTTANINTIKFLQEAIPPAKAESICDGLSLFIELERRGKFNENNISFLYELIELLPRKDLVTMLDGYEAERLSKDKGKKRPMSVGSGVQNLNLGSLPSKHKSISASSIESQENPVLLTPGYFSKSKQCPQCHKITCVCITTMTVEDGRGISATQHVQVQVVQPEKYSMKKVPSGKCIIFNNSFEKMVQAKNRHYLCIRKGTHVDSEILTKTFKWLNFDVEVFNNESADGMVTTLKYFADADKVNHDMYDCFVCCILSHGFEHGIYGNDGKELPLSTIKTIFDGKSCRSLLQKPKLFFIQACQGNNDGEGVKLASDSPSQFIPPPPPLEEEHVFMNQEVSKDADFLMFMACTPGTISWRSPVAGSWFIQTLCNVLQEHAAIPWSLYDMLVKVNNLVSQREEKISSEKLAKQMSDLGRNTLRKKLFFKVDGQNYHSYVNRLAMRKEPVESPSTDDPSTYSQAVQSQK